MKNLRNRVQIIGNLGDNPILNETANGIKYSKISVATNSVFINKDGEKTKEDFTALIIKLLQKTPQNVRLEISFLNSLYYQKKI